MGNGCSVMRCILYSYFVLFCGIKMYFAPLCRWGIVVF